MEKIHFEGGRLISLSQVNWRYLNFGLGMLCVHWILILMCFNYLLAFILPLSFIIEKPLPFPTLNKHWFGSLKRSFFSWDLPLTIHQTTISDLSVVSIGHGVVWQEKCHALATFWFNLFHFVYSFSGSRYCSLPPLRHAWQTRRTSFILKK